MPEPYPTIAAAEIAWLSIAQMVEADRLAVEEFNIALLQMMEHAGAGLAHLTDRLAPAGPVTVLAGGGNNGGGGLCAARHLANLGREVEIVLASERLGSAPRHHLDSLAAMGISPSIEPSGHPTTVDAIVGYGLEGSLRGTARSLARATEGTFIVSLDIPSGHRAPEAVIPAATLTLVLPNTRTRGLSPLYLADIGLPAALWRRLEIENPPAFAGAPIVQLTF